MKYIHSKKRFEKEVSYQEIFDEYISKGDTKEEAAEIVLNVMTSGTYVAFDEEKIKDSINMIINKFSK